ncbi:hypothetical protein L3Q67_02675 [Saccharothrix sp. AJ9571]|nr:hypothetical protein L3Q67_02675 [Saccharothrix sp. AJ9571]
MSTNSRSVARFVTVTMGMVIGLTFLFGFGNVLNLALKLGVPVYVAPLVAPAVDLTVLGLLVGTRHLALSSAGDDVLRPARRLLLAASVVTLLLNVADPVAAGQWGKAAFDAVGPLLLIGWAEAGPGLLRALNDVPQPFVHQMEEEPAGEAIAQSIKPTGTARRHTSELDSALLELARRADAEHWRRCRRPISAETLRKELRVGAATSRELVAVVRSMNGPAVAARSASAERLSS